MTEDRDIPIVVRRHQCTYTTLLQQAPFHAWHHCTAALQLHQKVAAYQLQGDFECATHGTEAQHHMHRTQPLAGTPSVQEFFLSTFVSALCLCTIHRLQDGSCLAHIRAETNKWSKDVVISAWQRLGSRRHPCQQYKRGHCKAAYASSMPCNHHALP